MTVSSGVEIGNMALANIGNSHPIEDFFPNDRSTEAFQITLWYDHSREEALESHNWNFARKRAALSEHATEPPSGQWTFRYVYPSDCIKIRKIVNPVGRDADRSPFQIEIVDGEKTILTDVEAASAVYTFDQTQVTLYSPKFINALSYLLAHYIAAPLVGDQDVKARMLETFTRTVRSATGSNAQEGGEDDPREAEWISGRT